MKTAKNLFDKICAFENLIEAAHKAQQGKKYKDNVAKFNVNLETELLRLHKELTNQTYQPGNYRTFYITDPKKRMISAAPYCDRVVHHAICNIIEPIFEKTFIFDTYANRTGKGSHAAIHRCQDYMRQYNYYLKTDIRKYFPSIDHAILKKVIRQKIGCEKTLWLIDLIIDNSNPQEFVGDYFVGDDLFTLAARRKGLPMGNLTSQYFANIYLTDFDHFVKEQLNVPYIRYVDDFVLFHDNKTVLHNLNHQIIQFLSIQKRLLLHVHKTIIAPSEKGMTFLGQRIFPTHRLLKKVNIRRFYKRLKTHIVNLKQRKLTAKDLETSLNAWVGHALQADTYRLREKIKRRIVFDYHVSLVVSPKASWLILAV